MVTMHEIRGGEAPAHKQTSHKFKYVGDPNDKFSGPDTVQMGGYTFRKGEVVEIKEAVENKDEVVILSRDNMSYHDTVRKLRNSSHFVDMSDKDQVQSADEKQKVLEKAEADKKKAEEAQLKADETEAKEREERQKAQEKERNNRAATAENAPRPPGTVTREPMRDAFGGRTVEQRTQAEDHTKAGKTKS